MDMIPSVDKKADKENGEDWMRVDGDEGRSRRTISWGEVGLDLGGKRDGW